MNILLARILKYLNGTLVLDDAYHFCVFFIYNYQHFQDYSLEDVCKQLNISPAAVVSFLQSLGYQSYEEFIEIYEDHKIQRLKQIDERMENVQIETYVNRIKVSSNNEEFLQDITHVCTQIHECKRVILVGALYPMSLAVEMQTDLISFGKPVLQFHTFDHDLHFSKGDYVIFTSATGRSLEGFMYQRDHLSLDECQSLLITQNPTYQRKGITNATIRVPGRFDGINFNYQIMTIFDLIRILYYQTYIQK